MYIYIYSLCRKYPAMYYARDTYWRRYKIQETLYIRQWHLSPLQSMKSEVTLGQGCEVTLGPHTVLPITISCPTAFFWISLMMYNLFPFKGDFSFGKSQALNLGCKGDELPGWLDISPKRSAGDVMQKWAPRCDEAANQQLLIAAAFWIIWIVSMEERSSLAQNLMQIRCSPQSFWMWQPHSTHAHSMASTIPTD